MDNRSLFRGCVKVDENNGVYAPQRFTQQQCEQMLHYPEAVQMRIRSTAGVQLVFETTVPVISFDFSCDDFAREYVVFDIWENDQYTESAFFPMHTIAGTVSYTCRSTPCKLTIYLPHLARTELHNLKLGDAHPAADKKKRILFYGDSLTQGMTSPRPSFSWTSLVANALGAEMLNLGIGGKKFQADVLDQTEAFHPDAVVVAYGINDSLQEEETPCMEEQVPAFFRQLRALYPQIPIYAITAPVIRALCMEASVQVQLKRVRALTRLCAKEQQCVVVNGKTILPKNQIFIAEDAHPNELGMQQIAQALLRYIPSI